MSAANQLRLAAARLRARAQSATEGPWRVCAEGSEGSRIAPAGEHLTLRERSRFIGILNGRVQPEDGRNAAYIATMHPGVGLALADWLDATACPLGCTVDGRRFPYCSACEDSTFDHECPDPIECEHTPPFRNALALARLINGGAP
jgi:hypothetical protein